MDELALAFHLTHVAHSGRAPVAAPLQLHQSAQLIAYAHNDVEHARTLLVAAFDSVRHSVQLVTDPAGPLQLQVDEYENLRWDDILAGRLVASAYCVRKGLNRKANFAAHVNKVLDKRHDAVLAAAIPRTIVINLWDAYHGDSVASWGYVDLYVANSTRVASVRHRDRTCVSAAQAPWHPV